MRRGARSAGLIFIASYAMFMAACGGSGSSNSGPAPAPSVNVVSLNQGWTDQTREAFHFTSQGAEMLQYDYFLALEQADSTAAFAETSYLESFRYLPAAASAMNPDGLPIGFTKTIDPNTGVAYFGPTCAMCHTSQINYKKTGMLIDGAGTLGYFNAFFQAMVDALQATVEQPDKFNRFADTILTPNHTQAQADALFANLADVTSQLERRNLQNAPAAAPGFGRVDAFGNVFNLVMGDAIGEPSNVIPPDDAVSIPFLWTTPNLDLVQWNGSASNAGLLGPLARNVGEAIGVFGNLQVVPNSGYPSSIDFVALGKLEVYLEALLSPQWPEQYLPHIDQAKAAAGKTYYTQICAECHQLIDRTQTDLDIAVHMVPANVVGTDPGMAEQYVDRNGQTGILEGTKEYIIGGEVFGETAFGYQFLDNAVIGAILDHPFQGLEAAIVEYEAIKAAQPFNPDSYKARPLNGIWATAPYLHNGSVPSLAQMLTPPAERISKFYVGSREFDPSNVGFITRKTEGAFLFDTTIPGNTNVGHEWGTTLSEKQKKELIEFLKTL